MRLFRTDPVRMEATIETLERELAGATDEQLEAAAHYLRSTWERSTMPLPAVIIAAVRRTPGRTGPVEPARRARTFRDVARDDDAVRRYSAMLEDAALPADQRRMAESVLRERRRMERFGLL